MTKTPEQCIRIYKKDPDAICTTQDSSLPFGTARKQRGRRSLRPRPAPRPVQKMDRSVTACEREN